MTKQEQIREILEGISSGGLSVGEGLRELDIAGVVIKVKRGLPWWYKIFRYIGAIPSLQPRPYLVPLIKEGE